jgi:hypothetical protein
MVLTQTPAKDVVKLSLSLGQLDVCHNMWLRLLVNQPVVTMSLHMAQFCLERTALYMSELQPTMLHTWEHHKVALLNLLYFHNRLFLVD